MMPAGPRLKLSARGGRVRPAVPAAALVSCLALLLVAGCSCEGGPGDPGDVSAGGELWGAQSADVLSLSLASTQAPLRVVQLEVELQGARALDVVPRMERPWRLIEAGLDAGDRARFTLVLADERRLLVSDGPVADIRVERAGDDDWTATLHAARGINDEGKPVELVAGMR